MRAARRESLLALEIQDRRFGWPLEMVLRAHAGRLADRGGDGRLPAQGRDVEGDRHGARDRARGQGHVGAAAMTCRRLGTTKQHGAVLVMAKAPVAGPGEDPADAARSVPSRRRASPRRAWRTPSTRCWTAGPRGGCSPWTGEAGPWLPGGFEVLPQRGTAFDERLASAWADCRGLGTADRDGHPAGDGRAAGRRAGHAARRPRVDAVLGSGRGRWLVGDRAARDPTPASLPGHRDESRGHGSAAARAAAPPRPAVTALLPVLRDVDTVADLAPGERGSSGIPVRRVCCALRLTSPSGGSDDEGPRHRWRRLRRVARRGSARRVAGTRCGCWTRCPGAPITSDPTT